MKTRFLLTLVIVVLLALSIGMVVQASHVTPMEACASHGLGPNFVHAEGANSPLIHCLDVVNTAH